jgi:hypothetical protein
MSYDFRRTCVGQCSYFAEVFVGPVVVLVSVPLTVIVAAALLGVRFNIPK